MKQLYNKARNDQWELSDVCMTVIARYGTGGGNIPVVLEDEMSYQKSTGTLTPGAHPGSYNGQDAWNDMLVTDDGTIMHGNRTSECRNHEGGVSDIDG